MKDARVAALRLLKFKPRSETELKRRLLEKGFGQGAIEPVMEELKRKGMVDDVKFSKYFVTQQVLSRPVGQRLLLNRLRSKGVNPHLAEQAVQAGTEGQDEFELARALADKRRLSLKALPRETAQRRLFGYLSRRGFSSEVVWKVIRERNLKGSDPTGSDPVGFSP